MRRFSQRNQLVTLNEINITPLLDLAFVLLIIFIITTPLLEGSIDLKLPAGGSTKTTAKPTDLVTAEVSPTGIYFFKGVRLANEAALEQSLVAEYRRNPQMVVNIRASAEGPFKLPVKIIDLCQRNGITRFHIATEPNRR
jgi:biopolymer transport protein ExbD